MTGRRGFDRACRTFPGFRMRSFEVPTMRPTDFVSEIRTKLAARDYDRFVRVDLEGDELFVELRWMGATRFEFRIRETGEGFRAELVSQRVSPFHAAFAGRFEGYFEDALAGVGARVV
jgi:CBS domain-containing protein